MRHEAPPSELSSVCTGAREGCEGVRGQGGEDGLSGRFERAGAIEGRRGRFREMAQAGTGMTAPHRPARASDGGGASDGGTSNGGVEGLAIGLTSSDDNSSWPFSFDPSTSACARILDFQTSSIFTLQKKTFLNNVRRKSSRSLLATLGRGTRHSSLRRCGGRPLIVREYVDSIAAPGIPLATAKLTKQPEQRHRPARARGQRAWLRAQGSAD